MKLVAAKCPSCGADIDVDKDSDSTKCEFCNSKIIVDDAIAKYKVEISGKIDVNNLPVKENLKKLAERHYEDHEYDEAYNKYQKICELDPDDPEAVLRFGICKINMQEMSDLDSTPLCNAIKNSFNILSKAEAKPKEINKYIKESEIALINLVDNLEDYYEKNKLREGEVDTLIDKEVDCLDKLVELHSKIKDDESLEKSIIEHIFHAADILTQKRKIYPNGPSQTSSSYPLAHRVREAALKAKDDLTDRYNYLINKDKPKEEQINNKQKPQTKSNPNDGIFIFLAVVLMLIALGTFSYSCYPAGILFIISALAFIPPIVNSINDKTFQSMIIPIRIIFPFFAFLSFGMQYVPEYVNTWESDSNTVTITKSEISINIYGEEAKGKYETNLFDTSDIKTITFKTDSDKTYVFKYEKIETNKYSFCLVEEDQCKMYFTPKENKNNYEFVKE